MDDLQYLESLITDKKVIAEIEETTHHYYKTIFNHVRLLNIYKLQLKESEDLSQIKIDQDLEYKPKEVVDKLDSPNVLKTKIKDLVLQINLTFEKLYDFSNKNNYYWCNSTLKTYKFYFEGFQRNFARISHENNKIEFLKHEIKYFLDFEENGFIVKEEFRTNFIHRTKFIDNFSFIDYYEFLFESNKLKIKTQNRKIIEFLKSEAEIENYTVKIKRGKLILKTKVESIKIAPKEEVYVEESLKLKDIPSFDTLDRFELIKELKIDSLVHNLDTSQKSKYKVLALIMGIHPDSARKLLTNKYPKLKTKEEILELSKIANENVKTFLNNPNNDIKIP